MIRLALMLAGVVVMSAAGSPVRAKKDDADLSGIGGRECARCIPRRTAQFGRAPETRSRDSRCRLAAIRGFRLCIDHFDTVLRLASTAMGLGCQPSLKWVPLIPATLCYRSGLHSIADRSADIVGRQLSATSGHHPVHAQQDQTRRY